MFRDENLNWASFRVLRHAACVGTIIALSSTALHLPPALSVKLLKRLEEEEEEETCFCWPVIFFFCLSDGEHFLQNFISFRSANNAVVLTDLRPQVEGMMTQKLGNLFIFLSLIQYFDNYFAFSMSQKQEKSVQLWMKDKSVCLSDLLVNTFSQFS